MVQDLAAALGEQVIAMPQYSEFQPKPYRPRMSAYWYFDRWPYLKFMLREASSFFVAYSAVMILLNIAALESGPSAVTRWEACLRSPGMLIFNAIALAFVLLHTVTWFNLVPRVMARQVLGKPVPDMMVAAPNYIIWLLASLIVALFALRIV